MYSSHVILPTVRCTETKTQKFWPLVCGNSFSNYLKDQIYGIYHVYNDNSQKLIIFLLLNPMTSLIIGTCVYKKNYNSKRSSLLTLNRVFTAGIFSSGTAHTSRVWVDARWQGHTLHASSYVACLLPRNSHKSVHKFSFTDCFHVQHHAYSSHQLCVRFYHHHHHLTMLQCRQLKPGKMRILV